MTEEKRGAREKVSDGIKQGIGVLSAFKEALDETIQEAKEKGDLSADRAREVMKDALERAQSAAEGAKDRLDFVTQREFDGVAGAVDLIKQRVAALEVHLGFGKGDAEDADVAEAGTDSPDSAADEGGDDGTEQSEDGEETSE